ncbi:MAG: hypothetical protein EOP53_12005 [Sphingobacteriales bacterium]|nr:MAG: hypothetical protein EOP53_12005 [Sphingobacteriales bacterium]
MSALKNKEQRVKRNSFWTPAVVGLSDGIIISLAISTALFVVSNEKHILINITAIAAIAGATLISVGGYYAAKSRMEGLSIKSDEEEKKLKEEETARTIALFKKLDLGNDMQEQAASEIEKDSAEWKAYLQKNEQQFEVPDKSQLPHTAFIIGGSYLLGAIVPLIPYLFINDMLTALKWSVFISLLLLPVVGYVKSHINREPPAWGAIRLLLLGGAAVTAVWFVAKIFVK